MAFRRNGDVSRRGTLLIRIIEVKRSELPSLDHSIFFLVDYLHSRAKVSLMNYLVPRQMHITNLVVFPLF